MNSNIVRTWKDDFYRQSRNDAECTHLPENPVGELDLADEELEGVFAAGGHDFENQYYRCEDTRFRRSDCYIPRDCIHPRFSYGYDRNDRDSYRYNSCHHVSYRDRNDYRTYEDRH